MNEEIERELDELCQVKLIVPKEHPEAVFSPEAKQAMELANAKVVEIKAWLTAKLSEAEKKAREEGYREGQRDNAIKIDDWFKGEMKERNEQNAIIFDTLTEKGRKEAQKEFVEELNAAIEGHYLWDSIVALRVKYSNPANGGKKET